MSIIMGKLKLKGSFGARMEKREDKVKQQIEEDQVKKAEEIFRKEHNLTEKEEATIITFEPTDGIGRVITSSTTVQGEATKFTELLKKDDFILIEHPQSLVTEERKVACVMSDRSLLLYKAFSSDVMSFIQYQVRKQDEIKEAEESTEDVYARKMLGLTKKIHKNKDNDKQVLEYREKKGMWSYNKVRKEVDANESREKLLDIKAKKSRDKFCWI